MERVLAAQSEYDKQTETPDLIVKGGLMAESIDALRAEIEPKPAECLHHQSQAVYLPRS